MSKLEAIKAAITSKTARQVFLTKKHSPKILFVAGTVGVIGTVVLACRATLKVSDVLDQHEKEHNDLVGDAADAVLDSSRDLAEVERNQKLATKLKVKTTLDIAKLYLPAIGLGALSIGALTGSHVILTKRNGALMVTVAGLDRAYKEYRQRVATEFGEDTDRKFAMGAETITVEEKTAEGGIKTTTKDVIAKDGKFGRSLYAALFAEDTSRHFTREPGMNPFVLEMKQNHANDKLRTSGHIFLNEVYDILGLPRTEAGQFVGWIYLHDNVRQERIQAGIPVGDNYVSFGIFENEPEVYEAWVDGKHDSGIWLDFNVDGPIYDKI